MPLITCHHNRLADIRFQDGGLPHVIGACNYQVVRSSKDRLYAPEGHGFTYNHAAMLAYWKGSFWYEYLAGPKGEHEAPSAVYVCRSQDGIHWEKPTEVFPPAEIQAAPYKGPGKDEITGDTVPLVTHHRMGFYTTGGNRLLITSFYGICPNPHVNPNNGYGVGRVVRELYEDGSMSEIFFLRYNAAGGYGREQVDLFPYYEECPDSGFREACRELLADRLATQQWWEEEQLDQDFFTRPGGKALSYYTLPDGEVMGVFKDSVTSMTCDQGRGEIWSPLERSASIITSTGKVWGQKMPDGKYALVYNPSPDGAHRWPLAITTGENGRDFYDLACILPEIAPCRYEGVLKNLGAQYMRGITEANGRPDNMAVWIAYSVNKEDMWIARIPNPVLTRWEGPVEDDMAEIGEETLRSTWNLYVPSWGGAEIEDQGQGRALHLWEQDPYNRIRAERIFAESSFVKLCLDLEIEEITRDKAMVSVQTRNGQNVFSLVFTSGGEMAVRTGGRDQKLGRYETNRKLGINLMLDGGECRYALEITQGDQQFLKKGATGAAGLAERVVAATKYSLPFQGLEDNGRNGDIGDLPDADRPVSKNAIRIHRLSVGYEK